VSSDRLRQALCSLALAGAAAGPAAGVELGVSEGTGIAVTASADGRSLVFDLYQRLWRVDRRGGMAEPITGPELALRRPHARADGTLVAEGGDGSLQRLWLVSPDGAVRPLTDGSARDAAPRWYPDGRRVIFSSDRAGSLDLYSVSVADGSVIALTQTPGADETEPTVSATGRLTAWITRTDGRWELWLQDGGGRPLLVHAAGHPLSAPSIRPDDSVIVVVEEPADGARLSAVILSRPVVVKTLAEGEDFFRRPVAWLGRNRLLYTADGRIRTRGFGELGGHDIPWTAWISVAGPPGVDTILDADTPLLHHGRYVVRAGRVFDGRRPGYREGVDVVIHNDRIVEVSEQRPRDGVDVLAFPEAVLLPGLVQLGLDDGIRADDGPRLLGCGVTTVVHLPSPAGGQPSPPADWNTGRIPGPALVAGRSAAGGLADVRGIAQRDERLARIREARAAGAAVATDRLYPDLAVGASLLAAGSRLPTSPAGRQYGDVQRLLTASGARRIADRTDSSEVCRLQELLRRPGGGAYEALRRHTAEAARLLSLETSRGTIAPGMRADFLLVGGDPLGDSGDASDLRAVVAGGRFFTPAGLGQNAGSAETSENLTINGDSEEMSPIRDSFDISRPGSEGWPHPGGWR